MLYLYMRYIICSYALCYMQLLRRENASFLYKLLAALASLLTPLSTLAYNVTIQIRKEY